MKKVLKYLKPFAGMMSLGLTIKILAAMAELLLPYILSHIIDDIVPLRDIEKIILWGALMIVFAAVALIGNVTANRIASGVSRDFTGTLRYRLFESTMKLPCSDFDGFTVPSLESRITSDTYNVHNFISMMQRMGVRAPILLIGGIAITMSLDRVLSLTMIAVLPFISLTVFLITRKGVPLYTLVQRSVDRMTRVVREDCQGIRVIKAVSKEKHERDRFEKSNSDLSEASRKAGTTMAGTNPIITLLLNLGLAAVIIIGASRVDAGLTGPGKIIAFMQYFTLISMAMMSITRIFMMYTRGSASAERIAEVIAAPSGLPVCDDNNDTAGNKGYIVFDNVSFSYGGKSDVSDESDEKNNLSGISFVLKKGGTLGIIGATGSGKSTLIKLLMRFYDADKGGIYIDGRNIKSYKHSELSALFGVALQNDFLHSGTIEENISFGRDMTHSDIEKACGISQASEFISKTDSGYEHELTQRATNISGGQKQRLLIARAIAGNPDILILDDSSSALDYKTDSALRSALKKNCKSTCIIVAQRVSSVMNSDLILVLDEGKIIGSGTHAELTESCDIYRQISESQMGGAILD